MSMKPCPECGKDISTAATACPNCGAPQKKSGGMLGPLLLIFLVVIVIGALIPRADDKPKPHLKNTSSSNRTGYRISGEGWFGCIDREQMASLVRYVTQKDKDAFAKAFAMGLAGGTCTRFESDEVVHLMDTAIFSGLVKVRREGETQTYWTNSEAIRR
ncbi:MAG: zinc ribbon domain-containing protein [Deltaproteobacteria bacterium]|nr:zinc ribbon domain-containing protein [Deltaproteobacteria bacterium]